MSVDRAGLIAATAKTLDDSFDGVVLSSVDHVAYRNRIDAPHKFYRHAKEIVTSFNLCVYLNQKSCLTNEINNHILNFRSNGLMGTWVKKFVDNSYLVYQPSTEPRAMGLLTILGSVQLLLVGYLIGALIFIAEMLSRRYESLRDFFNTEYRR